MDLAHLYFINFKESELLMNLTVKRITLGTLPQITFDSIK